MREERRALERSELRAAAVAADIVLGQPDFVSAGPSAGPTGLDTPYEVSSNGTQLLIVDAGNARVLIHDEFPTTNNRNNFV